MTDNVGIAYEGGTWTRAHQLVGMRKGYHASHIVTPDIRARTTCEQRAALDRFTRYNHAARIVWREGSKGRLWWVTAAFDDLERRILKMARKHERGIRWTVSALARALDAGRATVQRVIDSLVKRALVTFTTTRGRYSRMVLRVVVRSNAQPIRIKDEQLISTPGYTSARAWARYTDEEQDKLRADAYAYRSGLVMSLAAVGFTGPTAEVDYLRAMGVI